MFELIKLFFIFFKIGLFTFGGGYAMIPMIRQEMVSNNYLTLEQVTQFIGIAESTPGPFAINMATFSGLSYIWFYWEFSSNTRRVTTFIHHYIIDCIFF